MFILLHFINQLSFAFIFVLKFKPRQRVDFLPKITQLAKIAIQGFPGIVWPHDPRDFGGFA